VLFNSIIFAIFLPIVFLLYWFATFKSVKLQNWVVVIASFFFYGWWDWRFLSLLLISTCVVFFVGIGLSKNENPMTRKILLLVSVLMNLGLLGFLSTTISFWIILSLRFHSSVTGYRQAR